MKLAQLLQQNTPVLQRKSCRDHLAISKISIYNKNKEFFERHMFYTRNISFYSCSGGN